MRNQVSLSDDEIEARFEELGIGLDAGSDDLVWTRETLEDFRTSRHHYNESGRITHDHAGELMIERVQVRKGDQRQTVTVIDFGPVRAVAMI